MGWVFDYGAVIGAEETQEACTRVELDDIDPDDPDAGYLYLHEMPASCVSRAVPSRALTLRAGPHSGWSLFEFEGTTAQIIADRHLDLRHGRKRTTDRRRALPGST